MINKHQHNAIYQQNNLFYVKTDSYSEGPFEDRAEARQFQELQNKAEMARIEFADFVDYR